MKATCGEHTVGHFAFESSDPAKGSSERPESSVVSSGVIPGIVPGALSVVSCPPELPPELPRVGGVRLES